MRPSKALDLYRVQIREVVAHFHAKNARVFGSVANGSDSETSDLDLLVDTTEETTLLDIARIQNQLQQLMHVSVDVLTPNALPPNILKQVLKQAKPV